MRTKCVFKDTVKNNKGEIVLVVVAYQYTNGEFGYQVFPCVGAQPCAGYVPSKTRAIIYRPIINRLMGFCSNVDELTEELKSRMSKSSATWIEGIATNAVVWNGKPIGYIGNVSRGPSRFTYTCCTNYDGGYTAIFNADALAITLTNYDFYVKHNIEIADTIDILSYNEIDSEPTTECINVSYH